jgi:CRISPR-associated protein Cmr3
MRPLWPREHLPTERTLGFLTRDGLSAFLGGETPSLTDRHWLATGEILDWDRRTGIGMDADQYTAEHGLIYGARYLALKPGIALYAEVVLPAEAPKHVLASSESLPLGGEGRRVLMQPVEPFDWPTAVPGPGQGTLVVLTTPGLFGSTPGGQNWKPACLAGELSLVSCAVPGFLPVSGWDLALSGPKPNRFAVPAGSVYFLEGNAEGLPEDSLADSPEDRRQGWACFVRGVWNDG